MRHFGVFGLGGFVHTRRAAACAFCATACLEHFIAAAAFYASCIDSCCWELLRRWGGRSLAAAPAAAVAIIVFKFYREIAGGPVGEWVSEFRSGARTATALGPFTPALGLQQHTGASRRDTHARWCCRESPPTYVRFSYFFQDGLHPKMFLCLLFRKSYFLLILFCLLFWSTKFDIWTS